LIAMADEVVRAGLSAESTAVEKYVPKPKATRAGIGLCLSGGGYRATLFHLGGLRRLNELGILCKVDTISSVSGGSIMAACLATEMARRAATSAQFSADEWNSRIAEPMRAFTRQNIRTGPILSRLLPWNWLHESAGVEALAQRYEDDLTPMRLADLPDKPNFVFCATDMAFGVNWVFEKTRMGDYRAGYVKPPPADWPVARAVAASACFPPIFNPLPVRLEPSRFNHLGSEPPGPRRDECLKGLRLTDGGNYDNLGLEPVWKGHAVVLVSDGGGTFDVESDKNLIWRIQRYTAIIDNQARALRKRWLISNFVLGEMQGAYWGIGSSPDRYGPKAPQGYSKKLAQEVLAEVRTDLDAFSEAEAAVLENHGYLLADAAVQAHLPALLSTPQPGVSVPWPNLMNERKAREALATSHERRLLGRS
jgi:NTE family protein